MDIGKLFFVSLSYLNLRLKGFHNFSLDTVSFIRQTETRHLLQSTFCHYILRGILSRLVGKMVFGRLISGNSTYRVTWSK